MEDEACSLRGYQFSLLILYLSVLNINCEAEYNKLQGIPDGLLVMYNGEVRAQVATWTVLVSLDEPAYPVQLSTRLIPLYALLGSLRRSNAISEEMEGRWRQRLRALRVDVSPTRSRARNRRGLFDAVGKGLAFLFGTATVGQVRELQHHVQAAAVKADHVLHVAEQLVSVVNHSRHELIAQRDHILKIADYVTGMAQFVNSVMMNVTRWSRQVQQLQREVSVNTYLDALESLHQTWQKQKDRYARERSSLELGWLTEDVLPPQELTAILESAKGKGWYGTHLEWYYEHLRVKPVWEETTRLVFSVEIPLVDNVNYLRYRMRTWPVANADATSTVQIQLPEDVAMDTQRGGVFEPKGCIGDHPAVCRTGPVYSQGHLLCARSVISGDTAQRSECPIEIRTTNVTELIEEVKPGLFIMFSLGDNYRLFCPGQTEETETVPIGLYKIVLKPGCRMSAKNWQITGLVQEQSSIHLDFPEISISPMNLPKNFSHKLVLQALKLPEWAPLPSLTKLSMSHLNDELIDADVPEAPWVGTKNNVLYIMCGILTVVIILFVAYELGRRHLEGRCKRRSLSQIPAEALDIEEPMEVDEVIELNEFK
jgi:hypothetical protein